MRRSLVGYLLVVVAAGAPGWAIASPVAGISIAKEPTRNVVCSAGVCTSSAMSAVLNVDDLGAMLAASSVTVKSAERGPDITVDAKLTWSGTSTLTLDAFHSVRGNRPVVVPAGAGLAILTNDHAPIVGQDGMLSFGPHGHVTFVSLSSALTINGLPYALVASVEGLAAAVAANQFGGFALAADYDARDDGVYAAAPVAPTFLGNFEGLGNAISHLTISSMTPQANVGLFANLLASVRDLRLVRERVKGTIGGNIGGLAGVSGDLLQNVSVDGEISGDGQSVVGGVAGLADRYMIDLCSSTASVKGGMHAAVGGLVGVASALQGGITRSYATGAIAGGSKADVGGLAGYVYGGVSLADTYAVGSASGGNYSNVGGLVGLFGPESQASISYSTGLVSSQAPGNVGGFSSLSQFCAACYWDITTSQTLDGVAGGNEPDIMPLTTGQLQSGLPDGFDSSVWGQSPAVNGGMPYLLANSPK